MARTKAKRRPAARMTRSRNARRRRALPKAKLSKAKARPKQTLTLSHYRDEDFKSDGLRAYAKYRDLGIKGATKGMMLAHVIRFLPPCRPEVVSKRHFHDV